MMVIGARVVSARRCRRSRRRQHGRQAPAARQQRRCAPTRLSQARARYAPAACPRRTALPGRAVRRRRQDPAGAPPPPPALQHSKTTHGARNMGQAPARRAVFNAARCVGQQRWLAGGAMWAQPVQDIDALHKGVSNGAHERCVDGRHPGNVDPRFSGSVGYVPAEDQAAACLEVRGGCVVFRWEPC